MNGTSVYHQVSPAKGSLVSYLQHGDTEGRPRPKRILLAACGDAGPVAAVALAVGGRRLAFAVAPLTTCRQFVRRRLSKTHERSHPHDQ